VGSNVDIAKHARFKFQIIQPVFNHVAYADNASQLAVAKHRHVAQMLSTFMVLSSYIPADVDAASLQSVCARPLSFSIINRRR
jgi:hypothetical protein